MNYGSNRLAIRSRFFLVVVTVSILAVFCFSGQSAFAKSTDWLSDGVTVQAIDDPLVGTTRMINHAQQCRMQRILIGMTLSIANSCIYKAKSFRFGWVERYIDGQDKSSLAISVGTDSRFYMIGNIDSRWRDNKHWQASPESDDIVFSSNNKIMVFKDVPKLLSREFLLGDVGYTIKYPDNQFNFDSQGLYINAVMSSNGRWLVGSAESYGLYRMDLLDGSVRLVAEESTLGGSYHLSISNDGSSIALSNGISYNDTNTLTHAKLIVINETCGVKSSRFWKRVSEVNIGEGISTCPWRSINDLIEEIDDDAYGKHFVTGIEFPKFNDNGDSIDLLHYRDMWAGNWIRLMQAGRIESPQLEYLAMGDSYSSGEGDIGEKLDGSTYYTVETSGKGQCHVSVRSYPFLLRNTYGISTNNMKSIACSGAQVLFDYSPKVQEYLGQHNELVNDDESARIQKRQAALDNFTPGILPQIEFVKKYKPKVITFTGGGNDVGFARILAYCATPHWEEAILPSSISDCGYAKEGSMLQEMLFDSINTQYFYNKKFIDEIKEASPETRITIVGYPSFISDDNKTCSLTFNSGALSQAERSVINNALTRMNSMLRRLAYDASVNYVHIEDTLIGGRMCEGSEYITGITDVGYSDVVTGDSVQEIFHPNALAHQKITDAIRQSGVFEETVSFDTGDYSPNSSSITTLPARLIHNSRLAAGSVTKVTTKPFLFNPGSSVSVSAFSNKVDLGVYRADLEGKVTIEIDASTIGIGKHVLILEAETFSVEPVRYYQFIDVLNLTQLGGGAINKSYEYERGISINNSTVSAVGEREKSLGMHPSVERHSLEDLNRGDVTTKRIRNNKLTETAIGIMIIITVAGVLLIVGVKYSHGRTERDQ